MSAKTEGPSLHVKAAQTLIEELRAMREVIPNFAIPQKGDARRLVSVATLPPEFIELSAAAVRNNAPLSRPAGASPEQVRDLMDYARAYHVLADEFDAMTLFLRHSVAAARNKAGHEALTTYALARRLAKQSETAYLAPVAEAMRRALGKRVRKGKARPEPEPETNEPDEANEP